MNCTRCKKRVDTSKEYITFGPSVGDKDNKNISEQQRKAWGELEIKKEKAFCLDCSNILETALKEKRKNKKIIDEFFKLAKI